MNIGIGVDGKPQTWSSQPIFQAAIARENSWPDHVGREAPYKNGYKPVSLPVVAYKPRPARSPRIALALAKPLNDQDHPRVAKDRGPGPYRNQYGATCVALVQAKGLPLQVGFAKNIPAIARAAGYQVNLDITKGSIFVTGESSAGGVDTGHSGIILDDSDPNYVYVQEQNYEGGRLTEGWVPREIITNIIHLTKI